MNADIFKNTMANITWQEMERLDKDNARVILPVGVIEEHGIHLSLAIDIYPADFFSHTHRQNYRCGKLERHL